MNIVVYVDYLDYCRIEVDMLEVEMDTRQEWFLPGFSSSPTEQVCAKNALRRMVPSWLFKFSYRTSLCDKCTFCFRIESMHTQLALLCIQLCGLFRLFGSFNVL